MNINTATTEINKALVNLELDLGEPVFDEWVLASSTPSGWVVHKYNGNREKEFLSQFSRDVSALRETIDLENPMIGDFAFSHEGHGKGFDAHMVVGERTFVLFNNTEKSTSEITKNPFWKTAQIHFSTLLETFIVDPIV